MDRLSTIAESFLTGLEQVGKNVAEPEKLLEVGRILAPTIDKIIRIGNDDNRNDKSLAAVTAFTVELWALKQKNSDVMPVRENHQKKFTALGLPDDAMDIITKAVGLKLPPELPSGHIDAIVTDYAEHASIGQTQADNSADIANKARFSELKGDAVQPILNMIEGDKDYQDRLIEVLNKHPGKEGSMTVTEMKEAKEKIAELVNSTDKDGLINYLETMDPKLQFALGNYMKGAIALMQEDFAVLFQASLDEGLEKPLKAAFNKVASTLPDRVPMEKPIHIALKSRYMLTTMLAVTEEVDKRFKDNPNYKGTDNLVESIFNKKAIEAIEAGIKEHHGIDVKISKQDILDITKNLGTQNSGVKTSKETQQLDIRKFLSENKGMVLGAIPMVLGPLTAIFSKLPIVGGVFAGVSGFINDAARQFGPYVFSMFMQGGTKSSAKAEAAEAEPAEKVRRVKTDYNPQFDKSLGIAA